MVINNHWTTIFQKFVTMMAVVVMLLVVSLLTNQAGSHVDAADELGWMQSGLAASLGEEVDQADVNTGPHDCYQTTLRVQRYTQGFNNNWLPREDRVMQVCALQTPLGFVADTVEGTYIQFTGTTYAQKLVGASGLRAYPVPGQRTVVTRDGTSTSYASRRTRIHYNIAAVGESVIESGERVFRVNSFPDPFRDADGNTLEVDNYTFSRNGEWMVANVRGVIMRIHVKTKAMQTIGKGGVGSTSFQFAISNDGQYVYSRASFGLSVPSQHLYDLRGCQPSQEYEYSYPHAIAPGCTRRDIGQVLRQQVSGFFGLSGMRFNHDGYTLTGYMSYTKPGEDRPTGLRRIKITPEGYVEPSLQYLALGDSFASGEGDTEGGMWYEPGTDTSQNKCHLSRRSYPYLIATQLGWHGGINQSPAPESPFHSIACSGARSTNIFNGTGFDPTLTIPTRDNQYSEVPEVNGLGDWMPGYIAQIEFMKKYNPEVTTISAIGNNIGFTDKLIRCLEPDTCYNTYEDRKEIALEIQSKFEVLTAMYQQLKEAAGTEGKIYVLGYPRLADPNGNCAVNVRLNQHELKFANELVHYLNAVIESAAEYAGVMYVDVESALRGKELCAGPSSELAVNGLTAGNDQFEVVGNESYHPNHRGHELYVQRVLGQTESFTRPMPTHNYAISPPLTTDDQFSDFFADVPKANRPLNKLNYDNDTENNVVYREQWLEWTLQGIKNHTAPHKKYSVFINSTPTYLGDFVADGNGDLVIAAKVPGSLTPGFHTLHAYGENLAGESVDIYRTIYVAASEDDYDGDGISNSDDACIIAEPSRQDRDKDGIDDACDGYIGLPSIALSIGQPDTLPEVRGGDSLLTTASVPLRSLLAASPSTTVVMQKSKKITSAEARSVDSQPTHTRREIVVEERHWWGRAWPAIIPVMLIILVAVVLIGKFYKITHKVHNKVK